VGIRAKARTIFPFLATQTFNIVSLAILTRREYLIPVRNSVGRSTRQPNLPIAFGPINSHSIKTTAACTP
jgi:hypothetical protein